jgi:hypothetical protein
VPKIARTGAGAGWLGEPDAMIAMAKLVVSRASLSVTVKTRIGTGREGPASASGDRMPIVDLARRLEDAGVRAIAIHCRVAKKSGDDEEVGETRPGARGSRPVAQKESLLHSSPLLQSVTASIKPSQCSLPSAPRANASITPNT